MPKDTVRRVAYWYATVPAGGENALLQRLATGRVDLLAYLAFPLPDGRVQIDLFPRGDAALEGVLSKDGMRLSARKEALLVEGSDRPGALAEHLSRLSTKGIPVVASTAIATPGGGYGFLIFVRPERLDDAARTLSA
jgi:hypothetical protein